jgi:hypothetical protein
VMQMRVTPGSVVGPCRNRRGLAGECQRAHGQSDQVKPWAEERSSIDHSLSSLTPPVPIGLKKSSNTDIRGPYAFQVVARARFHVAVQKQLRGEFSKILRRKRITCAALRPRT